MTIPNKIEAGAYPYWQATVGAVEKDYLWRNHYPPYELASEYLSFDVYGIPYIAHDTGQWDLTPFSTTQNPPTESAGYHFWVLQSYHAYHTFNYQSGGDDFTLNCILQHDITMTEKVLKLFKCDGFSEVPLNQIWYSASYSDIYFIVYTDDDLSYIDTEDEVKTFIYDITPTPTSWVDINYPAYDAFYSTSTVDFSTNYWNIDGYTHVGFRIIQTDNYFETTYLETTDVETDFASSYTASTTLNAGAYFVQSYLRGTSTAIYSDEVRPFYVLTNPYATPTTTPVDTSDVDCSDFGTFGGALCKVGVFLFRPSSASLNRFSSLKNIIETKAPFAYFYVVKTSLSGLGASTTPAFVLQTGAVADVFNDFKLGFASILWLLFGFYAIRRIVSYNL